VRTFPCPSPCEIELTYRDFRCRCPVNDSEDRATVRIVYEPHDHIVEYADLRDYLAGYANESMLHEEVTAAIANKIQEVTHPRRVLVETTWAPVEGIEVTVRKEIR
jgi:NADPH-dependent 7-cyano-7-deazaguanine reductase QueF